MYNNTNLQERFDETLSKELLGFVSKVLFYDFQFFGINNAMNGFSIQKLLLMPSYFENNNTCKLIL